MTDTPAFPQFLNGVVSAALAVMVVTMLVNIARKRARQAVCAAIASVLVGAVPGIVEIVSRWQPSFWFFATITSFGIPAMLIVFVLSFL